ncbi:hypothetical protein D0Z07_0723 [Hyphodiscus hymeniophilus]|uniref:NAD(P)-binding protein n=1 Tax=Hyphodiscus hymeniophilus TaxID=353542 RepID=A0A9P6VSY6_9HELO|nr:hypothetical protein D0Z07_0723 [Hyphodiscus hymeniophilus]
MSSYLIVGASRGLGYAWLQFLSKNPANTVVGLARTPAAVEEQLAKDGITNIQMIPGDMSSHASMAKAAELATPLLPSGLDHLIVNGAYMSQDNAFLAPSDFSSASKAQELRDEMYASLNTNVLGVVFPINAFLPLVLKGAVKKVIVISTGMADPELSMPADGSDGVATAVVYSAMKAALNIIVAKYAMELRAKGVKTLALCPGVVLTSATPPSEKNMAGYQKLFTIFSNKYPHFKGPASPFESIEKQLKVIDNLTFEDSGKFLSHKSTKEWL